MHTQTLSLVLPDFLATASREAAKELGMARAEFIRQAIKHELENFRREKEQAAIAKSLLAMKNSKEYMDEAEEIIDGLNSNLPEEKDEWWKK